MQNCFSFNFYTARKTETELTFYDESYFSAYSVVLFRKLGTTNMIPYLFDFVNRKMKITNYLVVPKILHSRGYHRSACSESGIDLVLAFDQSSRDYWDAQTFLEL